MGFKLGVIGIDHRHILGMLGNMPAEGCHCARYRSDGPSTVDTKFAAVFPGLQRVGDRRRILDDPDVAMVLIAAVPADRAALAIEATEAGKDVMIDKPGCTTLQQLAAIRIDWFTPDASPTWGDGRLFIQGTDGFIELRKRTDIGRPHASDNLFLVNGSKSEMIPCSDTPLPYFPRLVADVQDRAETAVPQARTFAAMRIAIEAQATAERRDASCNGPDHA